MSGDSELESYSISELREELRSRQNLAKLAPGLQPAAKGGGGNSSLTLADSKAVAKTLTAKQKGIYGVDDRRDYYEFGNDLERTLAESVAALFRDEGVTSNGDGTSNLFTVPLSRSQGVCGGERFAEQPTGAFCTGFLVAPDVIATAGHCINETNVGTVRFVFGFRMTAAGKTSLTIPDKDIYSGKEMIGWMLNEGSGEDWSLVRLDRPVVDRTVLALRTSGRIADNAPVFVMGHPSGLPLKFADGSNVRDNTALTYFVANLDTYGGNSGSPVFGADGVVEGILVRGGTDYVSNGNCFISLVCPTTGCRGEDCTRITEVAEALSA
ncbi:serine protease (plasmid) [Rhizobium sophoriradicis]|uniref:trypsin-like serine peptidase n=1 Tax=Rhizobium sophoriradicis TaxID=1535245 RepID=UPI0016161793|nr:serine protease [Rhizobium leguminosarum bv. phaseoli]